MTKIAGSGKGRGAQDQIDFRQLFDGTPAPLLVFRPDMTIVAANEAYLRVTMTKREDMLGRNVFEIFPDNPDDSSATWVANLRASITRVLSARARDIMPMQRYDIRLLPELGGGFEERYWSPVNSPIFDRRGQVAFIVHRVEDVTDLARMRAELRAESYDGQGLRGRLEQVEEEAYARAKDRQQIILRLREANEALARLDRAKTAFFSNVSHEFRTPLSLIAGPLRELLKAPGARDERLQVELTTAYRNALRLLKLATNLVELSRLDAGRVAAVYEPTDLVKFTAELANLFRAVIEQGGLRYIVSCSEPPQLAYVDREMWEKVVLNLISNAFKFTLEGEIEVTLKGRGDCAELTVRDTGAGIREPEQPHLFERYHHVDEPRRRTREGAGIGLALVQELVKLHGGGLSVQSIHGEGSAFAVSLPFGKHHLPKTQIRDGEVGPFTPQEADLYVQEALGWLPASAEPMAGSGSSPIAAERPRILLADDSADMCAYMARLLSDDYDVHSVGDGGAALREIRHSPPELVIADVMMMGLSGIELVREIRRDPDAAAIPVIILSAGAAVQARVEGIRAGADDYLAKPFSADELRARVAAQIHQNRHHKRERQLRTEATLATARLEMILESVNDAFFAVGDDWRIIFLNAKAIAWLGLPRDTMPGSHLLDLRPPDSLALDQIKEAMQRREEAAFDEYAVTTNGWWEVRIYPSPAGVVAMATDITMRKIREQNLRETEARLQMAVGIAQVGFWELNLTTNQVHSSPEWKQQLGYGEDELADTFYQWESRLHPDDRGRAFAQLENFAIMGSNAHQLEYRMRHKDGHYLWFEGRMRMVIDEDYTRRLLITHVDITEKKQAAESIRQIAQHDALTGLPNRALLYEFGHRLLAQCKREGRKLALLFFDLDQFKAINDTHGHAVGDQLLRDCAQRISHAMRTQDAVGRLGGDEFVAIAANIAGEPDAIRVAEHCVESLDRPYLIDELELRVSPSIGIAIYPQDALTIESLIEAADRAMYVAKQEGRNTFRFCSAVTTAVLTT